jgi:8-amino-7-oxononanoate synthase
MDLSLDSDLRARLEEWKARGLRRELHPTHGVEPNFASNDYLGLARHPALIEAAQRATAEQGTGAGAARLVTGTTREVLALEEELAAWKEKEAALVFGSGFAAALGAIPALVGAGDTVLLDKRSHASLIDGARLSGSTLRVFPHNNLEVLERTLRSTSGRRLIVTESLFSMDGDVAPLRELVELKEKHGAWLLVDEAHATGVYGATGAGLIAEAGLSARVEIILGTLSKALGSVGGYIAGSRVVIDWLLHRARSFVYSTALPPGAIAASRAAVALARGAEGSVRRENLRANIALFRSQLPAPWESTVTGAIQPLLCGEAEAALRLAAALRERGFLIPAIRYPTVARHAARLRVTLSAAHSPAQIEALVAALSATKSDAGALSA